MFGLVFFKDEIINLLLRYKSSEEPKDQSTKTSAINNILNEVKTSDELSRPERNCKD